MNFLIFEISMCENEKILFYYEKLPQANGHHFFLKAQRSPGDDPGDEISISLASSFMTAGMRTMIVITMETKLNQNGGQTRLIAIHKLSAFYTII